MSFLPPVVEYYHAYGYAGYGSTNTMIPYFATEDERKSTSSPTLFSVSNSSTYGWSLTALKPCVVNITTTGETNGDYWLGLSVNSDRLSTIITQIADEDQVAMDYDGGAGASMASGSVFMLPGEVIRVHGDSGAPGNDTLIVFAIVTSVFIGTAWTDNNDILSAYDGYLTGYWRLEEASGTRVDAIGSNDLDQQSNAPGNATGIRNNSLECSNSGNKYIYSNSVSNNMSPWKSVAVSVWVERTAETSAEEIIFDIINAASQELISIDYLDTSDTLRCAIRQNDITLKQVTYSVTIPNAVWTHIALVADGSDVYLYYNGSLVTSGLAYDGTIEAATDKFIIGGATWRADGAWNGKIDEVAFWRNILFDSDADRNTFVSALYNSGLGAFRE